MSMTVQRPTLDERRGRGAAAAAKAPPTSHTGWEPVVVGPIPWPFWRPRTPRVSPTSSRCGTGG